MRAKRADKNQPELVSALRGMGISVLHLHMVGAGVPDVACGFGGLTMLAEIKTEKGKFTKAQNELMKTWTGGVYLLRNIENCKAMRDTFLRWHASINALKTGAIPKSDRPVVWS